jgi:tellurite resistance protein
MKTNFAYDVNTVSDLFNDFCEYTIDFTQRSTLFTDTLRKQGNVFHEHNKAGMPPVLDFDYEIIMDGRNFEIPVNYALAKIIPDENVEIDKDSRPIVIIDPRAGHGPGIGGFKKDSKIGVALRNKNPVYFVVFFPIPEPGQTLSDVEKAEIKFIKEVGRLHPEADKPAIVGNCQAGWAIALMAADEPDIAGPIMLNGSPLSYWAGKDGSSPMRYKGGLIGGIWMASLWADLGNQHFDGANLVKGFEDLNPSNTHWKKLYHVYSNIDTEEDRFLEFERWWNGFYFMTKDEIKSITENLFVGNKLESGEFEFEEGKKIDLKKLKEPVILFCSEGDNITPPTQALNWVMKVWGSIEEIKRHRQVIIYLIHENIGHLGIFVSGKVAKKEHKQIIGNVDLVEFLSPGLYEMVIDDECKLEDGKKTFCSEFNVKFEERHFSDILEFDDGLEDEKDFEIVDKISTLNDNFYEKFFSPIVKNMTNETTASFLRTIHPLRKNRYIFSDLNPALASVKTIAPYIKENRKEVSKENKFLKLEKVYSDFLVSSLDYMRDSNENSNEFIFKTIYGNPFLKSFFPNNENGSDKIKQEAKIKKENKQDKKKWLDKMSEGGLVAGACRIMIAMAKVDDNIDHKELKAMEKIISNHVNITNDIKSDLKDIIKDQSRILQIDEKKAINALPKMIKTKKDREIALKIAHKIANADDIVVKEEKALIKKFEKLLSY